MASTQYRRNEEFERKSNSQASGRRLCTELWTEVSALHGGARIDAHRDREDYSWMPLLAILMTLAEVDILTGQAMEDAHRVK